MLAYNKTRPDKGTNHQINSGNKRSIAHNSTHKRTCKSAFDHNNTIVKDKSRINSTQMA
jgi:hypothetical protein